MAAEPENQKMDELLKAYAKQRKAEAGDPLALHPATRKLLQDEVARTHAKPQRRGGWLNALLAFWPRIGLATATLVALGIVVLVVLPNREQPLVKTHAPAGPALSAAADREELVRAVDDSVALALADDMVVSKDAPQDKKQDLSARDASGAKSSAGTGIAPGNQPVFKETPPVGYAEAPQNRPAPTAAPAQAPAAPLARSELKRSDMLAKDLDRAMESEKLRESNVALKTVDGFAKAKADAVTTPAKPNEPAPLTGAQKNELDGLAATNALAGAQAYYFQNASVTPPARYVQLPTVQAGRGGQGNEAVLTSFELEKTGQQIRIVDADGSVYQGQVVAPSDTYLGVRLQEEAQKVEAGKAVQEVESRRATQQAQELFFRASGTNRSLRRLVNIEAAFTAAGSQPQSSSSTLGRARAVVGQQSTNVLGDTRQHGVVTQQLMPNIRGRARIGTNQEVSIEAIPAPR